MRVFAGFVVVLAMSAIGSPARGLTFTASGAGDNPGETLNASATFSVSNLNLVVTLSNTATFDPNDTGDIITGIFFSIAGNPSLTPVSANLSSDSALIAHRLPLGFNGDVGAEWAYRGQLVGAPGGATLGISSTSLKWFGNKNLFPGAKIKGAGSLGGISFGLTTLSDLPGNNKGPIKNQALIEDSVVFTFAGLPQGFAVSNISDVTFQYGTSLKQPELVSVTIQNNVPEPGTIWLVAMGMLGTLAAGRFARGRPSHAE